MAGTAVDLTFVREAALLHDIGILFTDAAQLGCRGELPYLCHGIKGRSQRDGRPAAPRPGLRAPHRRRSQRRGDRPPLIASPARDMLLISLEEQIVAYADLFFSRTRPNPAGNAASTRYASPWPATARTRWRCSMSGTNGLRDECLIGSLRDLRYGLRETRGSALLTREYGLSFIVPACQKTFPSTEYTEHTENLQPFRAFQVFRGPTPLIILLLRGHHSVFRALVVEILSLWAVLHNQ
ncbi:MAG: hypothetical protein R2864_13115 [Syntrophotaleaceae bacterium]